MANDPLDLEKVDFHEYEKLLRFFRGQVVPRLWKHCFHWKSLLAAFALATPLFAGVLYSGTDSLGVQDASSLGMSFGAIGFGACLTVAILAIGLPGAERARGWANRDRKVGTSNAYTELLFNIIWSALVQLGLILLAVASAAVGGDSGAAPAELWSLHSVLLVISVFWFGYAMVELVHVLLAVSQMGVVIVREERRAAGRKPLVVDADSARHPEGQER